MNGLLRMALAEQNKFSVYVVLWLALGEKPGDFERVTVAEVVGLCRRYGVELSETQTRNRLIALDKQKAIIFRKSEEKKGDYFIRVFPNDQIDFVPAPESIAVKKAFPLFLASNVEYDGEIRRENDRENERKLSTSVLSRENSDFATQGPVRVETPDVESENSPLKKNNNINNKKINKPTEGDFLISNSEESRESDAVSPNGGPSTDEIRRRVDFENPKIARLRNAIARLVWEPSVNPDLVDRVAAAVVLGVGGANWNLIQGLVKAAVAEAKKTVDATFRKAEPIWKFLTLPIKRLYENAGWVWTKTRIATEPKPEPQIASAIAEIESEPKPVAPSPSPRPVARTRRPERPETPEQLRAKTMGITFADVQRGFEFCVEKIIETTDWGRTTALNYASIAIGAAKKLNELEENGRKNYATT